MSCPLRYKTPGSTVWKFRRWWSAPHASKRAVATGRATLLRRPPALAGTELRHHDIVLDPASNRAERAGRPLGLAAREHALLLFFMRHPGEVLSRTRLYEQVWEEEYDGLSNTLEVHVMELRKKLEAHGPRLLLTVRGRGYMLGAPAPAGEGA